MCTYIYIDIICFRDKLNLLESYDQTTYYSTKIKSLNFLVSMTIKLYLNRRKMIIKTGTDPLAKGVSVESPFLVIVP